MCLCPKGRKSSAGSVRTSAAHAYGEIVEAAEARPAALVGVVVGSFETGRGSPKKKRARFPRPLALVLGDFLLIVNPGRSSFLIEREMFAIPGTTW